MNATICILIVSFLCTLVFLIGFRWGYSKGNLTGYTQGLEEAIKILEDKKEHELFG